MVFERLRLIDKGLTQVRILTHPPSRHRNFRTRTSTHKPVLTLSHIRINLSPRRAYRPSQPIRQILHLLKRHQTLLVLRCAVYFRIEALNVEEFGVDHFLLILLSLSLDLDLEVLFLIIILLLLLLLKV